MYDGAVPIYDALYHWKDYAAEAEVVRKLIEAHGPRPARTLLDVACGTGRHMQRFAAHFDVSGVDLTPGFVDVARERCPDADIQQGDMREFDLGCRFDVITCLFSSIAHCEDTAGLNAAWSRFAAHLEPGGIAIVEPWFTEEAFFPDTVHMQTADEPELKIARACVSRKRGNVSVMDLHHLVATPAGIETFVERIECTMYTADEFRAAIEGAGLECIHDPDSLPRGAWIGRSAS